MNVTTKLTTQGYADKLVTLYGKDNGVSLARHYLSFWRKEELGYKYWQEVINIIEG